MNSVQIPEGKIVYGYGGKKFKPGMTVKDTHTSSEIIDKLIGKKKEDSKSIVKPKKRKYTKRKKIGLDD